MDLTKVYLIHDGTLDLQLLSEITTAQPITVQHWDDRNSIPLNACVLLYISDEQIKELTLTAIEKQWTIALLGHPDANYAVRSLGVKGNLKSLINHYYQSKAIESDVLTCNGQIVLSSVAIGEVHSLRPYDAKHPPSGLSIIMSAFKAIRILRLHNYTLTTAKDQKIHFAALGMVVAEQTQSSLIGGCFSQVMSKTDGRLTLLSFSPRSVLSYLWVLFLLVIPKKISLSSLPDSIGLIRSKQIQLEADKEIDYLLDGASITAKIIQFKVLDLKLRIIPGPALVRSEEQNVVNEKDNIKISHLPIDKTAQEVTQSPLPFFSRAGETDYRELFVSLRNNANLSSTFLVLMILSVLLALSGLYANSAPVIIGAMILAPLMSPIISLAMGLARTESSLIRNSMITLVVGISAALSCAILVAWMMPLENLTAEMRARLSPTLLDLSVAIISGIAGAYAHAKEEVAKSLAGVAIAVALIPPLSVAGIGIGWADWSMARGAFLLFITNMFGISLAASVTFLAMGFAPFKMARKGLMIGLLLMSSITIPLYIAFIDLVEESKILREIPVGTIELNDQAVELRIVKVKVGDPPLVQIILSSSKRIDGSHVDELKQLISKRVGRTIQLEAQINLKR
jgi:uncharacterized hydrophobic protein (TIGR00271 family)